MMDISISSLVTCAKPLVGGLCLGYFLGYLFTHKSENINKSDDTKVIRKSNNVTPTHTVALVVNSGLKMKKGKIAAQCGHAILGLFKRAKKKRPTSVEKWVEEGQDLLIVSVPSSDDFDYLGQLASMESLEHYVVADAGRTQIEAGSLTVLAIGPSDKDTINKIVGQLPLYL